MPLEINNLQPPRLFPAADSNAALSVEVGIKLSCCRDLAILPVRDWAAKLQVDGKGATKKPGASYRRPRHRQAGTTIVQALGIDLENGIVPCGIPEARECCARKAHAEEQCEWSCEEQDEEYEPTSQRQEITIRAQPRMNK